MTERIRRHVLKPGGASTWCGGSVQRATVEQVRNSCGLCLALRTVARERGERMLRAHLAAIETRRGPEHVGDFDKRGGRRTAPRSSRG